MTTPNMPSVRRANSSCAAWSAFLRIAAACSGIDFAPGPPAPGPPKRITIIPPPPIAGGVSVASIKASPLNPVVRAIVLVPIVATTSFFMFLSAGSSRFRSPSRAQSTRR